MPVYAVGIFLRTRPRRQSQTLTLPEKVNVASAAPHRARFARAVCFRGCTLLITRDGHLFAATDYKLEALDRLVKSNSSRDESMNDRLIDCVVMLCLVCSDFRSSPCQPIKNLKNPPVNILLVSDKQSLFLTLDRPDPARPKDGGSSPSKDDSTFVKVSLADRSEPIADACVCFGRGGRDLAALLVLLRDGRVLQLLGEKGRAREGRPSFLFLSFSSSDPPL